MLFEMLNAWLLYGVLMFTPCSGVQFTPLTTVPFRAQLCAGAACTRSSASIDIAKYSPIFLMEIPFVCYGKARFIALCYGGRAFTM